MTTGKFSLKNTEEIFLLKTYKFMVNVTKILFVAFSDRASYFASLHELTNLSQTVYEWRQTGIGRKIETESPL